MSNNERIPKFKVGDIVYLVTGGPSMSVVEPLLEYHAENYAQFCGDYNCQWFIGKKLKHGTFAEESLILNN